MEYRKENRTERNKNGINNFDITNIIVLQVFGYQFQYKKLEHLKHKRITLDNVSYFTKKAKLIFYKSFYNNDNNFYLIFLYRHLNGNYFKRYIDNMGERKMEIINEEDVLIYFNNNINLIE